MTMTQQRRFPLEPVTELAGPAVQGELARRFGVTRRTVSRWARDGVPEFMAERVAALLGWHPVCIWQEWYE